MAVRARPESGQATVEAALVLPLLAMAMLVVIQVGTVAYDRVLVAHAAREAARAAAVAPDSGVARQAAIDSGGLDPGRLGVHLSGGRQVGDRLTVTINYASPTNIALVGWMVGDVGLSSKVTMRVE